MSTGIANKPFSHFTKTHYSSIPLFQHSSCERSELSSFLGCQPSYSNFERRKIIMRRTQEVNENTIFSVSLLKAQPPSPEGFRLRQPSPPGYGVPKKLPATLRGTPAFALTSYGVARAGETR
jgi:hypothetical protein